MNIFNEGNPQGSEGRGREHKGRDISRALQSSPHRFEEYRANDGHACSQAMGYDVTTVLP
jgi:hypothetical protein